MYERRTGTWVQLALFGCLIGAVLGPVGTGTAQVLTEQQGPSPRLAAPAQTVDLGLEIQKQHEIQRQMQKRLDALESWRAAIEKLPVLNNKVNLGLNALQWLYTHQDAKTPEGKSQDNISIRRSEVLAYGKINDYIPKWHILFEFQSINLTNATPDCSGAPGGDCTKKPAGTAASTTFFRESYIDYRPVLSWAPTVNFIRLGIFRMPFGIFTETSGGLRDVISSPYLTSVGSGNGNRTGTAGTIDFIHERDYFVDVRGRLAERLDYVFGIMNNNNFQANALGANGPKVGYGRLRLFATDVSWISFTLLTGESNNTNTAINGRGKGKFDRFGIDARYTSKLFPGLMLQGEWWQGHDGANQTTVGRPAQGACQDQTICGGSGAPGVQRRTWYVLAKYLITEGPLRNWEPTVMYEEFDPSTSTSNDLYTRWILGLTYYFQNLPPKIQTKVQFNYEFRHHQGNGPGQAFNAATDPFAQNAFLVQFQVRFQ